MSVSVVQIREIRAPSRRQIRQRRTKLERRERIRAGAGVSNRYTSDTKLFCFVRIWMQDGRGSAAEGRGGFGAQAEDATKAIEHRTGSASVVCRDEGVEACGH